MSQFLPTQLAQPIKLQTGLPMQGNLLTNVCLFALLSCLEHETILVSESCIECLHAGKSEGVRGGGYRRFSLSSSVGIF